MGAVALIFGSYYRLGLVYDTFLFCPRGPIIFSPLRAKFNSGNSYFKCELRTILNRLRGHGLFILCRFSGNLGWSLLVPCYACCSFPSLFPRSHFQFKIFMTS